MKIGLQIPRFNWPGSPGNTGSKLAEIATAAENAGFYSLWVMDHFFQVAQGYGPPEDPMLEGYSTLSFFAAVTQKVKLGLMVTANPYRHPGVLVKTVTTLDVLSGGRAYLGIGTGWYEWEARALGIPFPQSLSERFGRRARYSRQPSTCGKESNLHLEANIISSLNQSTVRHLCLSLIPQS